MKTQNQFTLVNKIPYVLHIAFDFGCYMVVRYFFGFEVALIYILANIGCDIVRGIATLIDELKSHTSEAIATNLQKGKDI